jgi:predicted ribosome quality control (RQC) complex YloA/Tae2 family protein
VQTDWLIVRRLAAELDRALRGARIRAVGLAPGGRFALRVPRGTVVVDAFGSPPVVTLEGELELERAAGWVRTMADTLEGLRIERVRSRRGDRLIAFECAAKSRFGVESRYRLVAELVPRFGNVLLLKDDTIVSAAREFTRAENERRATVAGDLYEPPPLPEPAFAPGVLGAIRSAEPLVPRLVAQSLAAEAERTLAAGASCDSVTERAVAKARSLTESADGEPAALGDIYAYWEGPKLVAVHVVPLMQFAALRTTREPELLPLLSQVAASVATDGATRALEARRATLRKRFAKARAELATERAARERDRDDAAGRDAMRRAGDILYANVAAVPRGATSFASPEEPDVRIELDPGLDAKGNAAAYFKRYRKAVAKATYAEERLTELEREERFADELAWEIERCDAGTLAEVAEGIERLERRRNRPPRTRPRRTAPLEVRLADDARIYVGRSPRGNADLTFRVARPDDLWFHARGTPGAHVVLHLDNERPPRPSELESAAALAAHHSKARSSQKVAVDYTERKFVRRRQDAPPGLVWYTNARTITVAPAAEPNVAVGA